MMHSRAGRRRIISRTSSNSPNPNGFQLDENHPDNDNDDDDEATHPRLAAFVPSCGCSSTRGAMATTTTRMTTLVLQFITCFVLCNLTLRFISLVSPTTWMHNDGPLSTGAAANSRNQQRMERKRQRQQNSAGVAGMKKAKEQENNWKVPFREHRERHHQKDLMNPHDSHPPDTIPLFSQPSTTSLLYLSESALQRRHECIAAIRKQHDMLLGPFLTSHHFQKMASSSFTATTARRQRHNVLLVDPAYHKNVGDHMITLGEIAFLQRMGYITAAPAAASSTTTRPVQRETTEAEKNLNNKNNTVDEYDECTYIQGGPFLPLCDDLLKQQQQDHEKQEDVSTTSLSQKVALWHGGGNWGDLWPKVQSMRASSLESLYTALYNPIISMPQSLYFDDEKIFQQENTNSMRQAVVMKEIMTMQQQQHASTTRNTSTIKQLNRSSLGEQQHERRLILTWREQKSYDMAVKLYPFATNLIVPDIAFQLGPFAPIIESSVEDDGEMVHHQKQQRRPPQQLDILLLLRDDHESLYLHQRNRQAIRQMLSSITLNKRNTAGADTTTSGGDSFTTTMTGSRLLFAIVDWSDRLDRFQSSSSSGKKDIFFTNTSIQLLSLGRVLVCDRLHAAILAYLMGIPFVFVDQSTGKIHRTLHTAFTSAGTGIANHNDTTTTTTPADDHDYSPCLDATAAMWAQADNLTHALEKAIGFLDSRN